MWCMGHVMYLLSSIPNQDVVECLHTEYRKYGRCKVAMGPGRLYIICVLPTSKYGSRDHHFLDHNGDRVGFIDFVHHDDAREAKNAKGHLVRAQHIDGG